MRRVVNWCCALCFLVPAVQAGELKDLYQQTIQSDPRLQISKSEVDVGVARYDQAKSQLLPQVRFNSTWTENQRRELEGASEDHFKGEKYSLMIQQKLFDLDKWHNRSRYEHLSEESKARLLEKEMLVTTDLLERYLDALAKQDALELVVAELQATEKQLELLKSRYKRQLAVLTDVLTVEARLDGIRADEIGAQADVEIAMEALSELVGGRVAGPLGGLAEELVMAGDLGDLDKWVNSALANNLVLQGLNYQVRAAESGLRQARAADLPVLDLTLSAQKSDIGFENSQSARTENYVASLNFTLPLYLGGSGKARKAENRALLSIAQQDFEEARRRVLKDVRASYLKTLSSGARISAARKAVESGIKSYEAQQKSLQYGTVTVVDVLDALRENSRFKKDFRQAQYDYIVNWVQLLSITGMLSIEHIEVIDSWHIVKS